MVADLAERNHEVIGQMVSTSLSPERLPDRELVREIEAKVGDDLQFIRLNGAAVGFLIGIAIGLVRLAMS